MVIFAQRPEKVSLFATAMLGLMPTQPTNRCTNGESRGFGRGYPARHALRP